MGIKKNSFYERKEKPNENYIYDGTNYVVLIYSCR